MSAVLLMVGQVLQILCLILMVMACSTAISCANMAIADYDQVIPLDEVIETMKKVGDAIPNTLRCTGLGGLGTRKALLTQFLLKPDSMPPSEKSRGSSLERKINWS